MIFRENIADGNRESCVSGAFVLDSIVHLFLRNLI